MTGSAPPKSAPRPLDNGHVERALVPVLEADLDQTRCVLLVGPYEVGKSHVAETIAWRFGAGASVLRAKDPDHYSSLTNVLRNSRGRLIVIDEIHAATEALDTIRLELESWARDRVPVGQFLLLSSRSLEAATLVAGRLGTRVQIRSLAPIGLADLANARSRLRSSTSMSMTTDLDDTEPIARPNIVISADMLRLRGGFPQSLFADDDTTSFVWREHYVTSLCSRGFEDGGHRLRGTTIRDFLALIAANQGEQRPIEGAAQKAYVDHLCDLGLLRVLRPWGANETKRMKRSPKTYIRDTGICTACNVADPSMTSGPAARRKATAGRLLHRTPHQGGTPCRCVLLPRRGSERDRSRPRVRENATVRHRDQIGGRSTAVGFRRGTSSHCSRNWICRQADPESITTARHPILTLSDMIRTVSDHSRLGGRPR